MVDGTLNILAVGNRIYFWNIFSRGNAPVNIRVHKQANREEGEGREDRGTGKEREEGGDGACSRREKFCSAFIIFLKLRPRRDSRVSNCQDSSTCCSLITPERDAERESYCAPP